MLEQAAVDLRNLKHVDIDVPVNPKYTIQEWLDIYAAQKASPAKYANFKKGTESQPGNYFSQRILFSFSILYFYMDHLSSNLLHLPSTELILLNSSPVLLLFCKHLL
jgi:hypothetical protein